MRYVPVNLRVVGEVAEPLEAPPELLRRPLEHLAAPQREKAVADEHDLLLGEVVRDVTPRVPADVDDLRPGRTEFDDVAAADGDVDAGDFRLLVDRSDDLHAFTVVLQRHVAAGVVVVVVRVEDVRQLPVALSQLVGVGRRIRRVDRGRLARRLVAEEVPVIVRPWQRRSGIGIFGKTSSDRNSVRIA